jgi:hypothetical protein
MSAVSALLQYMLLEKTPIVLIRDVSIHYNLVAAVGDSSRRAAHPEFAGATALVATPYERIWVYGPEDVRGRFLTSLGFKRAEPAVWIRMAF